MPSFISPPVVPKKFLFSFILVTLLFALWGFANAHTDPLVSAFKDLFVINNAQSSWVQMAFYGGYGTMAIPAALFIKRYSYKSGIILGLILYAAGALLCVPAASSLSFNGFLVGLYILTFGLAFLETTANPYILSMGDPKTATQRLNLAQAFNPIGSLAGMFISSIFVLSNLQVEEFREDFNNHQVGLSEEVTALELEVLPILESQEKEIINDEVLGAYVRDHPERDLGGALEAYKDGEIATFKGKPQAELLKEDLGLIAKPYMIIGFVVVGVLLIFLVTRLPETAQAEEEEKESSVSEILGRLLRNKTYLGGVVAQTFYVGAQIMCWTYIIQYAQDTLGMDKATAQNHNIAAMVLFLASRFVCTFFLKFISSAILLGALACLAIVATFGVIYLEGMAGLYCLMAISGCMSLMFPTIYGMALDGLGQDAKIASAGLILAIVGGAVMPRLQGGIIDMDQFMGTSGIRGSFFLPMLCFAVIALYALLSRRWQVKARS